ncbi:MAG TPA: ElyC/SanA/YdcF family protein [Anaerolineae bacterium]|nr:ElyC/SanA/YdcF family protein [Anaerolineae bacterium]HQH37312.1 ElyC/SanA/YdcF family protein [Anaerolineae bacterium]
MKSKMRTAVRVVLVGGALCAAWTAWTLTARYEPLIYVPAELKQIPRQPVAVVFGAGYWPSGALSMILKDRLDAAIELYRAGRVQKLLFSGDNRFADYNEPAKMLEYALAQGVPRDDIVLDYAGRRTYDTCYRARDIFQVRDVVLVTQRYHLPRALHTCHALGLNAVGYVADRQSYPRRDLVWYWMREVPALWRGWWDTYIAHPTPVLGEPLPIFVEEDAMDKH